MLRGGLLNTRLYIEQDRGSITSYSARCHEGRRIASTAAEATVNDLVARRMVKKQQMHWSERGANPLPQVLVALANGDLAERLAYLSTSQLSQTLMSTFVPVPLFRRAA
jgi:hypothetical protein